MTTQTKDMNNGLKKMNGIHFTMINCLFSAPHCYLHTMSNTNQKHVQSDIGHQSGSCLADNIDRLPCCSHIKQAHSNRLLMKTTIIPRNGMDCKLLICVTSGITISILIQDNDQRTMQLHRKCNQQNLS